MDWHLLDRSERGVLASMFDKKRAGFLVDTVLEGHAGTAMVDDKKAPNVAMLSYADVVVFHGDAEHPKARALAELLPEERAVLPSSEAWHSLLAEVWGQRYVPIERFAFTHEQLDEAHLRDLASAVPEGYTIHPIDLATATTIATDPDLISPDHVRNFGTPQDFMDRGFGFCATKDGAIVAGASTYAVCSKGIEIQVNTQEAHRGRGLATVLSARLILEAWKRGLTAPWDAANEASAALAVKLGYTPAGTWIAWLLIPEDE